LTSRGIAAGARAISDRGDEYLYIINFLKMLDILRFLLIVSGEIRSVVCETKGSMFRRYLCAEQQSLGFANICEVSITQRLPLLSTVFIGCCYRNARPLPQQIHLTRYAR
jgi:hypothetical protein